jgi:outer membrane protein OmpA-like peptidoglycan-associated protein
MNNPFSLTQYRHMRYRFLSPLIFTALLASSPAYAQYRQNPVITPAPIVVINPSVLEALRYVTNNNPAPVRQQKPVVMYPPIDRAAAARDSAEYNSYGSQIIPITPPKEITAPKKDGGILAFFSKPSADNDEEAVLWVDPKKPEGYYQPVQEPPPTLGALNLAQDTPAPVTRPESTPARHVEVIPVLRKEPPVHTKEIAELPGRVLGMPEKTNKIQKHKQLASSEAIKTDAVEAPAPVEAAPQFGETPGFTPKPVARQETPKKPSDTLQLLDKVLAEKKQKPTPSPSAVKKEEPAVISNVPANRPDEDVVAVSESEDDEENISQTIPPPATPMPVAAKPVSVTASEKTFRVTFDAKEIALTHEEQTRLAGIADKLNSDKQPLNIIGYAAPPGESNEGEARRISLMRALTVRDFLMRKGVSGERLNVRALGLPSSQGKILPPNRVDIERSDTAS